MKAIELSIIIYLSKEIQMSTTNVIKSGHVIEIAPGQFKVFDTKAEATDFLRLPKVKEAFEKLTDNNEILVAWLMENEDNVMDAFETGSIKRVTKADRKKLSKALDSLSADDKTVAFLVENKAEILSSFCWPSVKRFSPEERAVAITEALTALTGGNEGLVAWLATNEEAIGLAYEAGKITREVNPKAMAALAAMREKKQAEKAARLAAEEAAKDPATVPMEAE
jgi:hypothetical protein